MLCNHVWVAEENNDAYENRIAAQQDDLREDIATIEWYAQRHADEFGDIQFENGVPVHVVVRFTRQLEQHRHNIVRLVRQPELIDVSGTSSSARELQMVEDELGRFLRPRADADRWRSWAIGQSRGVVRVTLPPGTEDVAVEIERRFGTSVRCDFAILEAES